MDRDTAIRQIESLQRYISLVVEHSDLGGGLLLDDVKALEYAVKKLKRPYSKN